MFYFARNIGFITISKLITLCIVSLGSAEYQQNSSNYDKSMKLGMMVDIDHTNRFRVVDKMKYAYLGQRSRSKFTIE